MTTVGELIKNSKFIKAEGFDEIKPKISIFLPISETTHNDLLRKCINSILKQDFQDFELIIIDDALQDEIKDIIERFMAQDKRIAIIKHEKNIKLSAISEYEAFKISRGQKIYFACDDSIIKKDGLSALYLDQQNNLNHKITYGKVIYKTVNRNVALGTKDVDIRGLNAENMIASCGILIDRDIIEQYGFFDPHIASSQFYDWDLWRRLVLYCHFYKIDTLISKKMSPNNLNTNEVVNCLWTQTKREEQLLIENIEKYEIDTIPKTLSKYFYEKVSNIAINGFSGLYNLKYKDNDLGQGYILVICPILFASTQFVFDFDNDKYFFAETENFYRNMKAYLMGARSLIFVRNIPSEKRIDILINTKVDYYYYTDDNLFLVKKAKMSPEQENVKKFINNTKSLISSSKELCRQLQEYFSKDVIYLPCTKYPVFDKTVSQIIHQDKTITNEIRIGWCSIDKEEGLINLKNTLDNFGKKHNIKIKLVCFCREKNFKKLLKHFDQLENIELIFNKIQINYLDLLQKLKAFNPNFLIHTKDRQWKDIYKYKTLNFFITSLLVDAIPLIEKRVPYDRIEDENIKDYFIFDESKNLEELLEYYLKIDNNKLEEHKKNLDGFIKNLYPVEYNYETLDKIFHNSKQCETFNFQDFELKEITIRKNIKNYINDFFAAINSYIKKGCKKNNNMF